MELITLKQLFMGSGCFSPAPATGDIDIQILEGLYDEARNMDQTASYSSSKTLKAYETLKQKISKKGSLKKMCDYLSSHRFRLCGNLLHNYRAVSQSKIVYTKLVALIVLDQLLNMTPDIKEHEIIAHNGSFRSLRQNNSIMGVSRANGQSELENNPKAKTTRFLKSEQSEANPKTNRGISNILQEMTSFKFQGIYLSIVCLLMKEGGEIYNLAITNLIKYCYLSRNKFNNSEQVQQIMKSLTYHIQTNSFMSNSLKAYKAIIGRVRQTYIHKNLQSLKIFIQVWQNSEDFSGQKNHNYSSQSENSHPKTLQKVKIGSTCHQIISEFLQNCIDTSQYTEIYHVFMSLMDQKLFEGIEKIEDFLIDLIQELQLKSQFCKGLLLHLLSYVAFPETSELSKDWYQLYHGGNMTQFRVKYKNIQNSSTKINAIKKVSQWLLQFALFDINQMLTYHSNPFISAFVFNLFSVHQEVKDTVIKQLISFAQKIKKDQQMTFLNSILGQIHNDYVKDSERYTILCIGDKILEKQSSLKIQQNLNNLFLDLSIDFCMQNNLKVIKTMKKILSKVSLNTVEHYHTNICQFFISFNREISEGFSNAAGKINLIDGIVELVSEIPNTHYGGILQAYCQRLSQNCSQRENDVQRLNNNIFFEDLLCFQLASVVSPISVNSHLKKQMQGAKKKVCSKDDRIVMKALEDYQKNRKKLDICPNEGIVHKQLPFYQQSKSFFMAKIYKENQLTMTNSIFGKMRSVLSAGSVNGRDDAEMDQVLDIIRR